MSVSVLWFSNILSITYDKEVERLGEKLIPMVQEYLGIDEIDFDWRVEDFSKLEVEITVK